MKNPPLILIADDNPMNLDILQTRLAVHGYEIITAIDGDEALTVAREKQPDLILLDVMMPKMDGIEVCRRLRSDSSLPFMPIILVTAKSDSRDIVAGLEAGGDEYLTKPVDQAALVARVKSMLRIKTLHDTVQGQTIRLEAQSAQLSEWNRKLEQRVAEQLADLDRFSRLKRFVSPELAELIVSSGNERLLESHRREITVAFCDLRGFPAFSETAEPEEVMQVLREYHAAVGPVIFQFEGTLERFSGDGLMVFFNDPLPCPNPAERAVRMALAMRQSVKELAMPWRKRGHQLDFGVGIAMGYATLGAIGFEGRFDYGAIGPVTDLAARLCDEAKAGQILISQRVYAAVEERVDAEPMGNLSPQGLHKPVAVFNVGGMLEQPRPVPVRTSEAFAECPKCGTCYDPEARRCGKDGTTLTLMPFSRLLAGRYQAERRLGSGGMGTVYEATDIALERRVAVKLIREDRMDSPDAAERFRREALAAAGFAHPNVVTVHDFGITGTRAFLVMELLQGRTLREELQEQHRLTIPHGQAILGGVCAAVEAAHSRQLIHRDLKPENIFLVHSQVGEIPKVLDFGLAKFLPVRMTQATQVTGAGTLLGTLHYMSPEQLRDEPVDVTWDLWAVAALTYEMLTGAHPFDRATTPESIGAVLSGSFTPLSVHLPQARDLWQKFFESALALKPEKRPSSARILYSEFERMLAQTS